jgi:hypothetical protein
MWKEAAEALCRNLPAGTDVYQEKFLDLDSVYFLDLKTGPTD